MALCGQELATFKSGPDNTNWVPDNTNWVQTTWLTLFVNQTRGSCCLELLLGWKVQLILLKEFDLIFSLFAESSVMHYLIFLSLCWNQDGGCKDSELSNYSIKQMGFLLSFRVPSSPGRHLLLPSLHLLHLHPPLSICLLVILLTLSRPAFVSTCDSVCACVIIVCSGWW